MSSFLTNTTALAYLEFAAGRLLAQGHFTEIVTSPATGATTLRVDGVERTEEDVTRLLAGRPPATPVASLRF